MLHLRRAHIAPALLLFSAAAGIAAAFVPWLQVDIYQNTDVYSVVHWQSSTPLSPLPDLFHGYDLPFVLGYPPSHRIMAIVLFGPPALTFVLALAAWLTARPAVQRNMRWLARACLGVGLLDLAVTIYVLVLFTDPFHFHEMGVEDDFLTSVQPGLPLALAVGVGTIAAGIVLWLSRRARRENAAALPV